MSEDIIYQGDEHYLQTANWVIGYGVGSGSTVKIVNDEVKFINKD